VVANLIERRMKKAFAETGLDIPSSTIKKSVGSKPHPKNEGPSSPQVSKTQSQPSAVSLSEVFERWQRSHPRPEKPKSRPLDLSCYGTPRIPQRDNAPNARFSSPTEPRRPTSHRGRTD
jgi:hypothetical protein